jgi:hypothetical protein
MDGGIRAWRVLRIRAYFGQSATNKQINSTSDKCTLTNEPFFEASLFANGVPPPRNVERHSTAH